MWRLFETPSSLRKAPTAPRSSRTTSQQRASSLRCHFEFKIGRFSRVCVGVDWCLGLCSIRTLRESSSRRLFLRLLSFSAKLSLHPFLRRKKRPLSLYKPALARRRFRSACTSGSTWSLGSNKEVQPLSRRTTRAGRRGAINATSFRALGVL